MRKGIVVFINFFILLLFYNLAPAKVYLTRAQALKVAFPKAAGVTKKIIWFDEKQIPRIEKLAKQKLRIKRISVYIGKKANRILGYAFIDNVIGKKEFITYMVVLDPDGKINKVEILVFRESQGWEVVAQVWRKQFIGKGIQAPIQLGKDIINISGATLSCRSLAEGVRKILAIFQITVTKK